MSRSAVLEHCGFTDEDLDLLREYGDVLVPEDGKAPNFSQADPDGDVLALTLEQAGHRLAQILAILKDTPGAGPGERLDALETSQPGEFRYLRDILVCTYLSTPMIWDLVGYDGRKPHPPEPGEAEEYLAGGILDPVVARGPIYTTLVG
jgi:hypothetical protein